MNIHYYNRYISFLYKIKQIPRNLEISHKHHIVPRSLGGNDDKSNIIVLTIREHFLAHWMLAKAYNNGKMWAAFRIMCLRFKDCSKITSKMYELSELKRIEHTTGLLEGMVWAKDKWMTTNEYKKIKGTIQHHNNGKITVRNKTTGKTSRVDVGFDNSELESIKKGFVNVYDNENDSWHEITKEEFKNNKHRYNTANKGLVHCFLLGTRESISVSIEEFEKYNGIKYQHPTKGLKLVCPHCKKTGGNSLKRWHFDHCKLKGK